jgi:aspartate/methionine/tyrosine aminotransferase
VAVVHIDHASDHELASLLRSLQDRYEQLRKSGLALDLTRGKPGTEQLALSAGLDGILAGNYRTDSGTDVRNYGGLEGLPEARAFFGAILGTAAEQTLVGGNSSLTLMYQTLDFLLREGLRGPGSAWEKSDTVKFLCPSPGYDRHFAICQHLGIGMRPIPMTESGPDMDLIEQLVQQDSTFKGIWCVPRFSNPTGCVYSEDTVARIARLGQLASEGFVVMWDNAYAVHELYDDAPRLASITAFCEQYDTMDSVFQFGSTSKISFAGAGVAYMGSSKENLAAFCRHLAFQSIGPDKVNQLRHLRFLAGEGVLARHMARHAEIIRPRFEAVLDTLEAQLAGAGMGTWTRPRGGYFISFDSLPGLAREIVGLAAAIGVKLTPAGATFPQGKDPLNQNIRLAPTFPPAEDVQATVDAFVVCVQLATVQQRLQQPDQ